MRKQFEEIDASEVHSADGASILIADHGAHLLSWTPAGGRAALYLSKTSKYGTGCAIRGGVPIIFPQFGERGNGKRHGFARTLPWRYEFSGVEQGRAVVRFCLSTAQVPVGTWPHDFALAYEVACSGEELHLSLEVSNPSGQAWEFCAALHTYLQLSALQQLEITGLQHATYLDQVAGGATFAQDDEILRIHGETDRIYQTIRNPLLLNDGERTITVSKRGFDDVVIWNPGAEKSAGLSDMPAQDYASFVCVEAGAIMQPVRLEAGTKWIGVQSIAVGKRAVAA